MFVSASSRVAPIKRQFESGSLQKNNFTRPSDRNIITVRKGKNRFAGLCVSVLRQGNIFDKMLPWRFFTAEFQDFLRLVTFCQKCYQAQSGNG
jgi:hypothetical protein